MNKNKKLKQGISLIVLVITIIVIVILAVAVILSIANNNPIENANKAKFQSDVKSMQEELELIKASNYAKNNGENYNNPETKGAISIEDLTSSDKYVEEFSVKNGQLVYNLSKLSDDEIEWAKELGINANSYVLGSNSNDGVTIEGGVLTTNWLMEGVPTDIGTEIEIPGSVTSIGEYAFAGYSNLTSIIISSSVTSIGEGAFASCSSLTSVTIPTSVTSIGGRAFDSCSSLASINLPDRITSIGDYLFNGCSSLTSVTISTGVISIGQSSFEGCSSLTNISLPDGIKSIDMNAFYGCANLTNITIPSSVTSIGEGAFASCSNLTSLTIEGDARFTKSQVSSWGIDTDTVSISGSGYISE